MSEYRTDEETVEQIQRFWRENGLALVLTVVVAVGGVLGWRWWQESRATEIAAASARYLEWREALGEDGAATAASERIAATLRERRPDSAYASLLRFHAARRAVLEDDLAAARAELEAVLATGLPVAFHDLARLRLARLDLAAGAPRDALAQLDAIEGGEEMPTVLELRGDVLLALEEIDGARAAYDAALILADGGGAGGSLLEIKREDLALGDVPEPRR